MNNILVVVDLQQEAVDGAQQMGEAGAVIQNVVKNANDLVRQWDGTVVFLQDTRGDDYFETEESKAVPFMHNQQGTDGWQLEKGLREFCEENGCRVFEKWTYGCPELGEYLKEEDEKEPLEGVTFVGVCTDLCVLSNALMAKAFLRKTPVYVVSDCCASLTPENHQQALEVMERNIVHVVKMEDITKK